MNEYCTYFTALAFEALWTLTQVGARLVLTCPSVLAGFRQAFIYVLREIKHTYTQELHMCTLNFGMEYDKMLIRLYLSDSAFH